MLAMSQQPPTTGPDWRIVLESKDARASRAGTLEILPEASDEQDGVDALQDWAATFEQYGVIPDGPDWRSRSPIGVVRRLGRRSYLCRADCFESETQNVLQQRLLLPAGDGPIVRTARRST